VALLLSVVMAAAWLVAIGRFGTVSVVTAFLLGFSAYSVPALFGFYFSPSVVGLMEQSVSSGVMWLMLWAWFWVLATLAVCALFPGLNQRNLRQRFLAHNEQSIAPQLHRFTLAALLVSAAILVLIAAVDGPLFFLRERSEFTATLVYPKLLWRWVNLFGLIAALKLGRPRAVVFFSACIFMYFLAGDRTMLLITGVALAVFFFIEDVTVSRLLRPVVLVPALTLLLLLWLGKPIYIAIKSYDLSLLWRMFSGYSSTILLSYIEPFVTHTIVEDVIAYEFEYAWSDLLETVLAQLLLVPAWFGVESSAFNVQMQAELYPWVRYGMASNFLAQAWSLSGYGSVALLFSLLTWAMVLLNRLNFTTSGVARMVVVVIAAAAGAYFYRNSVGNVLSLVRQIVIVALALYIGQLLLWYFGLGVRRER
jgi:hypothetical protein